MSVGLKKFEECIEKVTYGNKIQRTEYLDNGKFPVVSQESKLINGFWNNEEDLFDVKQPVIVFGDHTRILKFIDFSFVLGADGTKIIKPKSFIDSKFFYYFLEANPVQSKGYSRHYRFLKELKINVPPIATQQKIVAKLDAIFAEIDTATAAAEANANNAEALFQSYLEFIFNNSNSDWTRTTLKNVCEKITDGTHQTPTYFNEGIIFLSSKNVTSGKIDWDKIKYIDEKQHAEMSKRVSPRLGDVLLAKNGTTGVAAMVDRNEVFDIYVSLALLRAKEQLLPQFLLYFVNSPIAKNQFNKRLKGIGVPNLHLQEIREVEINFPNSLVQQKELINKIESFLDLTTNQKIRYELKLKEIIQLKQSILQRAFNGELVKD